MQYTVFIIAELFSLHLCFALSALLTFESALPASVQLYATTTITTTDQIWPTQYDLAISATCMRVHHSSYRPSPRASCTDCCIVLCWSCLVGGVVVVVVACSCVDAGPELCTVSPDLCTLCLWCFPFFNWYKHSTCTGDGCHQLQLVLVELFHSATSTDSPLAHLMVFSSANCTGGAFSCTHWCKCCTYTWTACTVWCMVINGCGRCM